MFYLGPAAAMLLLFALLLLWGLAVAGDSLSPLESLLLPPLFLLGAWGVAMWLVGSLAAFNGAVALVTLLLLAGAGLLAARKSNPASHLKSRLAALRSGASAMSGGEKAAAAFVGATCALSFVQVLVPPSSGDYDSLVYHLAAPWQYVRAGRVVELAYDHHSYFPFAFEMLFAAPLSWFGLNPGAEVPAAGAVAAKLFHWAMLPATALLLVASGTRVLKSRRAGWMAALIWCSIPVALVEATTAYIDLGLCAFALATFHCAARAMDAEPAQKKSWILWAGAFAGAAIGSKYLGALYAAIAFAWLVAASVREKQTVALWKPLAGAAAVALVLGGGFYARNVAWTGSPVFPFAYEVFGGRGWTAQMAKDYSLDQASFGFGRGPSDLVWLPWRLTMTPFNVGVRQPAVPGAPLTVGLPLWPFSEAPSDDATRTGLFEVTGYFSSTLLSPLLLALGLPAILMRGKPRALGAWMVACGILWLFWAATGQYARYLLPAMALWCAACGWAADRMLQHPILKPAVALSMNAVCATALSLSFLGAPSWSVISGSQNPKEWLSRTFAGWAAMDWVNTKTPQDAVVAVWGEPRCLYLDRKYLWADDQHNNLLDYSQVRDWPSLKAALEARGARWILWNTNPAERPNGGVFGPPELVANLIAQNAKLQFEARDYRVYSLEPR